MKEHSKWGNTQWRVSTVVSVATPAETTNCCLSIVISKNSGITNNINTTNNTNNSFLGCAYPFYFYFLKIALVIIGWIFVLGGSFHLLIVNLNCSEEKCVKLLGFAIINYTEL